MKMNGTLRILLIEDDEDDYVLVRDLLSEAPLTDFELDWVKTFDAGLEEVCRLQHDAYLLDYLLGAHTGLELLSRAHDRGCDAPVILLTGKAGPGIDLEAMAAGAADYLVKDEVNANALERSIRYAIERKRNEQELKNYRDRLEELVQHRTSELLRANRNLTKEIQERERAEQALRTSEEKYRTLVESSLDIIFTVTENGVLSSLNPAFEKITGYSAEEWIGKEYTPLIHPDDAKHLRSRVKRMLRGEELQPAEMRVITKSGDMRVLEFKSAAQKLGNSIGLIGTARDITDRKKAEEQVLLQNKFLNTVLESLSHPFYVVDVNDYRVVLANSAATAENPSSAARCFSLFHKDNAPCKGNDHKCPLQEIKASRKPLITEHIHYDRDNIPRYVEVHGYPILNEQGEVTQIIEYCLDITDRKEMEENLRKAHDELELRVQQRTAELAGANFALMTEIAERKRIEAALRFDEKRLEALLQLSQKTWESEREIADYVLDQEVKLTGSEIGFVGFLDEEEKYFTLHAWSCEVMQQCEVFQKPAHFPIERAGIWAEAVKQRKPVIINEYGLANQGKRALPFGHIPLQRFMSIPVFEADRITAVAIVANKPQDYDQSDIRQLTLLMDGMWRLIQRERSVKALKDAERLAGIGRALSSVAHDMKTPLVAIGGFTKLVQSHLSPENPDLAKMQIVLNETDRLEKLVRDMLDFSKPLDLDLSREQISKIIDESLEITKSLAEKKEVMLEAEPPGPIELVSLDRARIKQALINLLTNAVQASPEGTTVYVRYRQKDRDLFIDIVDCGCGIPAEIRKEIFSPFFTTKREGTGLGLPIVRKIIEAHGGHIEILDNVEGGSIFRITIPIH